ncbi:unnamed protein product [Adineta ricciae]|uniref:G-protein coupled receptors family 1 profile domain-containing protein n=1 Tax=Adineta ricciae TaxID=249248 RepID=A0A814XLD8_ADIRI|nr:unnamed protein product [Adineta ricciae]CAF1215699.1 unnamed protein product [Adineta ricciae]
MSLNSTLILVQYHMNRYFTPILLIFGVTGCFFNLILFSQRQFRHISCCTYFLFASLMMMFGLLLGLIPHVYSTYYSNPVDKQSIPCKFRGYFSQSFTMMYRWLMTMACIDRYFSSSLNSHLRSLTNQRLANRIITIVILLWIILPLHNLYFLDIKDGLCTITRINFAIYHSFFTFSTGGLFPPLIMIVFIKLIHRNLVLKRKHRQRNVSQRRKSSTFRLLYSRDHQVLLMLFVQVAFYILTTIPWMIFILYFSLTYHPGSITTNRQIIQKFLRYFTEILLYLYPTLSFYVYTLTSKTFRRQFLNFICSSICNRNQQKILMAKKQNQWQNESRRSRKSSLIQLDTFGTFSDKTLSSNNNNE